jgi:hypothetical protein
MPAEPPVKHTFLFIDGQSLIRAAKEAFGYARPAYDVARVASVVCGQRCWQLHRTHFYVGIPHAAEDACWSHFWTAELGAMGGQGVNKTDWIRIERDTRAACFETRN